MEAGAGRGLGQCCAGPVVAVLSSCSGGGGCMSRKKREDQQRGCRQEAQGPGMLAYPQHRRA